MTTRRTWQYPLLIATFLFSCTCETTRLSAQEETAETSAASPGRTNLDEAMRIKVTSKGIRDLNQVIELLELAIDKGLDDQDSEFAEQMLSDSLMERATTLMQVIQSRPFMDQGVQKIRALITSDLRDVLAYGDPPPAAYLMLSKLQASPGGDAREARRAINSYLKFEDLPADEHAEALVLRARMLRDVNNALADLEEAIELVPDNMSYRLAKAILLRRAERFDDALATIEEVRQLEPENSNAVILQGEIYRQQNRIDDAMASFDLATEIDLQAPAPYQNRGEIYRLQGNFEQAIAQFDEVLKLQPGVMMTLLHRADAYMANGQFEKALADIELVLEKQPIVAAHRLRAEILTRMDRIGEAIEEMERVTAAMPDQVELKMQLALYYLVNKQPSKAIESYSDVIDQDPDNFTALQSRADSFLNIGKHAEAIADFKRALKLNSEDTTLLNNLAWVLATSPEDDLRDGERAIELATKACELTEYKLSHILSTLAAAYAESGDFESAIKWSQQSVDMNDPAHVEQLRKELSSYQEKKPWRERQSVEENVDDVPLVETPQVPPNDTPDLPREGQPNLELQPLLPNLPIEDE